MDISRRKFLLSTGAAAVLAPGAAGLVMAPKGVEIDAVRENSLWTSEVPPLPQFPRFKGERKVDLAIIGGGYTGLACAYYAKKFRPDWSVIVLESHRIGSGASSRNSGSVSGRYNGISDTEMPRRGFDRLRNFIETENIDCDLSPASILSLLTSESSSNDARADLAPGAKWIAASELSETISSNYYAGAVETPGGFKLHPAKLVGGHVKAALRVGAELFETSPALSIEEGRPAKVPTPDGVVLADNVFIATNAYTPRLGLYRYSMFPLHQYSLATRKLTGDEISNFGLDRWNLRFENRTLPVTFSLTPSGHFFLRMVLGYASFNSSVWRDKQGAMNLARQLFEQRYPGIGDLDLSHGWHGITGHTVSGQQIVGTIGDGNIHISAAYNGLGIMPGHNNGYLTACRITDHADEDIRFLVNSSSQIPFPGDYYRSLMLKPFMNLMTPV